MRPKPRKFEIKLDFSNNIRYFSARQHVSTSARQHAITAPLISTQNFIPFFSFIIRIPHSPTSEIRSFSFIRLCQDRTGEVFSVFEINRLTAINHNFRR